MQHAINIRDLMLHHGIRTSRYHPTDCASLTVKRTSDYYTIEAN